MQLKKRKLDTENELDTKAKIMGPGRGRVGEEESDPQGTGTDSLGVKRRRRLDDEEQETPSLAPLPQKKRVLSSSITGLCSPTRKTFKSLDGQPEAEDNEILIRETQAALKSLSGSWPHDPRTSIYTRTEPEDSPAFENLFEDKKSNVKMSPSSASTTSSSGSVDASCSLKDVITIRDQQAEGKNKVYAKLDIKSKQCKRIDRDSDSSKDKSESPRPQDKYSSRYEPPDFNDMVDDSSNDLEIDMSEPSNDRDDDECPDGRQKKKMDDKKEAARNSMYSSYKSATALHTFSSQSAFRPPSEVNKHGRGPGLGPYPAEATFVGYPEGRTTSSHEEQSVSIKSLPVETIISSEAISNSVSTLAAAASAAGKQYTVLQPAGAGSRATTALQEAARGAPSVAAVSECRPTPALSPASLGRGETDLNFCRKWFLKVDRFEIYNSKMSFFHRVSIFASPSIDILSQ